MKRTVASLALVIGLGVLGSVHAQAPEVHRWEYRLEFVNIHDLKTAEKMNDLGQQGWELFHVVGDGQVSTAMFKRVKP